MTIKKKELELTVPHVIDTCLLLANPESSCHSLDERFPERRVQAPVQYRVDSWVRVGQAVCGEEHDFVPLFQLRSGRV